MKKLVLPLALCLIASVSFGQKKVLNDAKREIGNTPPNIGEARNLIKTALSNPETENNAETWYVAGNIENKQFDDERAKEIIGGESNTSVMYEALDAVLPYFEKAYELDNIPNEKGKVKPKHTKDMRAIMKANRIYYINAGSHFYDKQDWEKAYRNFKTYAYMPKLPLMTGEKWDEKAEADTVVTQIKYFAALSASAIPDRPAAIQILNEIRNDGYQENEIYQRLIYEYELEKDSVNFRAVLKEGLLKFPGDSYYILNLINDCIKREDFSEAINLLNEAIAKSPNDPQLYDVLGTLYENSSEPEKAVQNLQKALEIDPTHNSALKHLGMVYYNQGVKARAAADNISDAKLSEEESKKGLDFYKQALPHLEKAFENNKDDSETIYCLRFIYYSLNMGEEFEKIDALFSE